MKQNIYDNPEFFLGYQKLRDHDTGLNGAIEDPAFMAIWPESKQRDILDLGCGFGDFCRFVRQQGAASVKGVDISKRMIEKARSRTKTGDVDYINCPIEDFEIAPDSYDIVVSRMALHYIKDYDALIGKIHRGLRDGGSFLFSVEHPICTALCKGWTRGGHGDPEFWPVDDYAIEGIRHQNWFVEGVIKYHRTIQTYVSCLLDTGFTLTKLLEPHAPKDIIDSRPEMESSLRRPPLLVISACK